MLPDYKFGMVPPGSTIAQTLPTADEVAAKELEELVRLRDVGHLTPVQESRLRDLTDILNKGD